MNYLYKDLFLWFVCLLYCCCSGHFSFMALWRNDKVDVNFKCQTINPVTAHVRALHRFVFTSDFKCEQLRKQLGGMGGGE